MQIEESGSLDANSANNFMYVLPSSSYDRKNINDITCDIRDMK